MKRIILPSVTGPKPVQAVPAASSESNIISLSEMRAKAQAKSHYKSRKPAWAPHPSPGGPTAA